MMKLVLTLPYFIHTHEDDNPDIPLLLFLHGIGEGFVSRKQIGHLNLVQQGPPKYLYHFLLEENHPLRSQFTMIAPQLPERATLWNDKNANIITDVQRILAGHQRERRKLYIMGFSKGGLGAFQVAQAVKPDAMVTMDASPMDEAPDDLAGKLARPAPCPFWAIYTDYDVKEDWIKIQVFNQLLSQDIHRSIEVHPPTNAKVITLLPRPKDVSSMVARHISVCDRVSKSRVPYEWLLQH